MIKILYIINNLNFGGAERLLVNLANNLDRTHYKPVLLLLSDKTELLSELKVDYFIFNDNLDRIGQLHKIVKLVRLIKKINPDIIHSHLMIADWAAGFVKFFFKQCSIISTIHGFNTLRSYELRLKHKIHFKVQGYFYRKFEKIVCVSNDLANSVKQDFLIPDQKIQVIYNGLENSGVSRNAKIRKKFTGKLLYVGRLVTVKNIPLLLNVLEILPHYYTLTIIGDGVLMEELKNLTIEKQVESRVKFLGYRDDVESEFKCYDILIIPSFHETFSLTALQGLINGIPTLCSHVGGMKEVLGENLIELLFDANKPNDLIEKIRMIEKNNLEIRGRIMNNRAFYLSFSLEKTIREYTQLYEEILPVQG